MYKSSRKLFKLTQFVSTRRFVSQKLLYSWIRVRKCVAVQPNLSMHVHQAVNKDIVSGMYVNPAEVGMNFDINEAEKDNLVLNIIAYDRTDPIIHSLLSANTVEEVLSTLAANEKELKKEHLVQCALVLWHQQNMFVKIQTQLANISDVTEAEYVAKLKKEPQFQSLLRKIGESAETFDVDELSCSLLYLSKMEVDLRSNTIQAILNEIQKKFHNDPEGATLSALSRTCVAFKYSQELWCQFFLLNLVPLIEKKMNSVSSPDDFRLLTICLMHTNHLLPPKIFQKYKELCMKMLDEKILNSEHGKTTAKVLTFMSLKFWAHENSETIRKLGKLLKGNIKRFDSKDIILLHKAFYSYLEPADLMEEISQIAKEYLRSENVIPDKNLYVGMLLAVAQHSTHEEKLILAKYLHQELSSDYFFHNMIVFFQILRSLKISDHKLCHLYWSKAIQAIKRNYFNGEPLGLLRIAHRYMYFNNNLGGTYRHYGFEQQMTEWIVNEILNGSMGLYPHRLSRGVSFLIAYCKNPKILVNCMERLIRMCPQLSHHEGVVVSRGVEIMLDLTKKKQIPSEVMEKLVELDTCLNECAWRHLAKSDLNITELNNLLRMYHNRRASPESLLLYTITRKLNESNENLNSRIIREVSYCTAGLGYLMPRFMDRIVDFIVKSGDVLLAETAERALSTMFYLGHHPKDPRVFDICTMLLKRDKERLSCLSVIQTCLALCFYNHFPADLVSSIFSVEFLERIDNELASCYSKAHYPVKVRYSLMELNRSVCLDLPELDVPWFHAKYCEEIQALDPQIQTVFHEDVGKQLREVLKDDRYVQTNVYSPYGYKINFLVLLDSTTKPLEKSQEQRAQHRIAFVLHSDRQFSLGERRLKGPQQLRQRHLEMLGYRVISIPEFLWNAMFLTEVEAKRTFLADKLWPER